jgi:hypothetical protein
MIAVIDPITLTTEDTPQGHHPPKFQRVLKGNDQREDGKEAVLQEAKTLAYLEVL